MPPEPATLQNFGETSRPPKNPPARPRVMALGSQATASQLPEFKDCSRWVGRNPAPLRWTANRLVPEGTTTLLVADAVDSIEQGIARAAEAIDDGRARETLDKLIRTSQ